MSISPIERLISDMSDETEIVLDSLDKAPTRPMTAFAVHLASIRFVIWREGDAVGWDCTVAELAEATGLAHREVYNTCQAQAWPVADHESRGGLTEPGADVVLARSVRRQTLTRTETRAA
jgi:hypothetical protein